MGMILDVLPDTSKDAMALALFQTSGDTEKAINMLLELRSGAAASTARHPPVAHPEERLVTHVPPVVLTQSSQEQRAFVEERFNDTIARVLLDWMAHVKRVRTSHFTKLELFVSQLVKDRNLEDTLKALQCFRRGALRMRQWAVSFDQLLACTQEMVSRAYNGATLGGIRPIIGLQQPAAPPSQQTPPQLS
eukprot:gnl/Hemi2/22966_TR7685_c0_g1_i1.p1 gnl/Hemi2/22966_TR7685_c0_g1~~gnl/Hemi2/22966_TR7685_c0_g1_i1.p1  ORF type:complete len:191 (+),score=33.28 gnl/Hemi2/22966_TR7685_c0_g1_i1:395-967(+)